MGARAREAELFLPAAVARNRPRAHEPLARARRSAAAARSLTRAPSPPLQAALGMSASDLGKQFTAAYAAAYASGAPASVAALYGADSVVSFDGTTVTGAAAVAATFIGPRLAGGPVQLRFSSVDAQFTPGGLALVLATGEATAPPGRFATAWLLSPAPGGAGMYVRAQFDRHGPGAAPQNVAADGTGMGAGFLGQYYALYAANRPALAGVYRPTSQLAFENRPVATGDAIARHLADSRDAAGDAVAATLPPGTHAVTALDAAQVSAAPPTVLALATGTFAIEGQKFPMNFAQAFVLVADATGAHVSNEVFRFNYA